MFRSKRPTPLPGHLRWKYIPIRPEESIQCWLIGPLVGTECHHVGPSKPCRRRMSDGALECPLCDEHKPVRWYGYVPILTRDREQRVVIVSSSVEPVIAALGHAAPVSIARPKGSRQALRVRQILPEELGTIAHENVRRRKPEDITPWLLHLWRDRVFAAWCGRQLVPTAKELLAAEGEPAPPPCPPPAAEAESVRGLIQSLAQRFSDGPDDSGERNRRPTGEHTPPNGRHPNPPAARPGSG